GAAEVHAVEALPELCKLIPKVLAGALPKEEDRRRVVVHCDFVENLCQRKSDAWPRSADVVVSEWLGILGLNEGMALPLLRCRDSFNPRPLMVPGLLRIWIQAAASAPTGAGRRCGPLACPSEALVGSPCLLLEADLNTCSAADLFEAAGQQLSLKEIEDSAGLVGWFDLHCSREHEDVVLSTSPWAPQTHWAQCWMPFRRPLSQVSVEVRLRLVAQTSTAGLPELCLELSGKDVEQSDWARFFLDRAQVEYGAASTPTGPRCKKPRLSEGAPDIEAVFFPSDVQELILLAKK
ncbi:Prmt3, partial [Symbiodinium sp. CCMP2456]